MAGLVTALGLLVADKQQGDYRLEIDWVRAYRAAGEKNSSI